MPGLRARARTRQRIRLDRLLTSRWDQTRTRMTIDQVTFDLSETDLILLSHEALRVLQALQRDREATP